MSTLTCYRYGNLNGYGEKPYCIQNKRNLKRGGMMIEHKEYALSFSINKSLIGDKILDFMEKSKECATHYMDYVLAGDRYRKYRRGKNRCLRCGIKKRRDEE